MNKLQKQEKQQAIEAAEAAIAAAAAEPPHKNLVAQLCTHDQESHL